MNPNKMNKPIAINTRIDAESYALMSEVADLTSKTITALIKDACLQYIELVKNPKVEPLDPLKIDQFAWSLKEKGKSK